MFKSLFMNELLRRLSSRPVITGELLFGSLLVNIMAMASPLFVMQVLNRYVGQGVDATLYTLTSGVLIAIIFEFVLRQSRMALARGISVGPDEETALKGFDALVKAKVPALEQTPAETRKEIVNGTAAIETAYNAINITTILDAPFSILFIFVLFLIEPMLALIVIFFVVGVFLVGLYGHRKMQSVAQAMQQVSSDGSALMGTATREADMIRSFNAGTYLQDAWYRHITYAQKLRREMSSAQGLVQTVTQSAMALMSVAVVAVGATLVVMGKMDVGAMIGGNILAARALQPVTRLAQLGSAFAKAREALDLFKQLESVETEAEKGSVISDCRGRIEFRDTAFSYPGSKLPIFEQLNLTIESGQVLVVIGNNGTGKSTFARLLLGLIEPTRGQILVDGLDMKQLNPEWWRRQVVFLPQEPALLNATIRENITINNPDIDDETLASVIDRCGLRRFLDESPDGLETRIADNGWRLSEGIRRRIALGRALATDGAVVVIDEPTESLDADGCRAVYQALASMAEKRRTIIIMSHDSDIVKGPHLEMNLNIKPVPKIERKGQKALPKPDPKLPSPENMDNKDGEA